MAKYLLAFHGGGMPQTPDEQARVLAAWGVWYQALGAAVVDPGLPIATASTIAKDGGVTSGGGANPVTGYTLITADSMAAAIAAAKGCPILAGGGSVEVAETLPMG